MNTWLMVLIILRKGYEALESVIKEKRLEEFMKPLNHKNKKT